MKSSNGFNKKQKEEIREIVKSEIKEALRKNAKPDINIKNEVTAAIYSVLNEKNENLIKNLSEIENKISQEETKKSWFASGLKSLLYVFCILAWIVWLICIIALVYLCCTEIYVQENKSSASVLFLMFALLAFILIIFSKSIKDMNKSDSYNALMFIITMIAFIITISTTL